MGAAQSASGTSAIPAEYLRARPCSMGERAGTNARPEPTPLHVQTGAERSGEMASAAAAAEPCDVSTAQPASFVGESAPAASVAPGAAAPVAEFLELPPPAAGVPPTHTVAPHAQEQLNGSAAEAAGRGVAKEFEVHAPKTANNRSEDPDLEERG